MAQGTKKVGHKSGPINKCIYYDFGPKFSPTSGPSLASASPEVLGLGGKYRQAKSVSAKDLENTNRQTYQSSRKAKYVEIKEPLINWVLFHPSKLVDFYFILILVSLFLS